MMRYIGIDVGKAKCRAAIVNHQGDIENEFRLCEKSGKQVIKTHF